MRILVQKYGGTSVATDEARAKVVERVQAAVREGCSTVVVVSAMGRAGDPYATDTLLGLATRISPGTSARNLDLLMSCGETISSVIVGTTLAKHGIDNAVLTAAQAGIMTDAEFGNAEVVRVETHMLLDHLAQGKVVVVPGFQGVTQSLDVTTLGRGGSDTTAAIIGGALKAELVEIYTDVDGVKTADPRIVPEARTIEMMTFDEVSHMANEGAKVIHPRAVEIAMQHNVPLKVRSTFDDSPGTLITVPARPDSWSRSRGVVAGVTHLTDLCRFLIRTNGSGLTHIKTFRRLADQGISVDMVSVTPNLYSFVVKKEVAGSAERELSQTGEAEGLAVQQDCAKVSVVGSGMRGMPGVVADVAEALYDAHVEILQTADSLTTISCLIKKPDLERAAQALHHRFRLDRARKPQAP